LLEFDPSQGVISKHRLDLIQKERRMAGKREKEEKKEITCFLCQKTEDQGVLLPCRKGGRNSGSARDACPCSFMAAKSDTK
jgi:hypothetical protein